MTQTTKKTTRKKDTTKKAKMDNLYDIILERLSDKGIDYYALQTEHDYAGLTPTALDTQHLKLDVLNTDKMKTEYVKEQLQFMEQQQDTVGTTVPDNYTEEQKNLYQELLDIREELQLNHYNNCITIGIVTHLLLDTIFYAAELYYLIEKKAEIADILLAYNKFDPYSMIPLERKGLRTMQLIGRVLREVEYYLVRVGATSLAAISRSNGKPKPVPKEENKNNSEITSANHTPSFDLRMEYLLQNTDGIEKENTKVTFNVGSEKISIQLSSTRKYTDMFNEIQHLLKKVLYYGNALIRKAKRISKELGYNLYSNSFTSNPNTSNSEMMQELGDSFIPVSKHRIVKPPLLLIINKYKFQSFRDGDTRPGNKVGNYTFFPGESQDIEEKRVVFISKSHYKTDSALDKWSEETEDAVENETRNEQSMNNSKTQDYNQYLDESLSRSLDAGGDMSIHASKGGGGINAGVELHAHIAFHQDNTTSEGSALNVNKTREQTVSSMDNIVTRQVQHANSERERATSDTFERNEREQREQKISKRYKNPNENSPINLGVYESIQDYCTVHTLRGIDIVYSNGSKIIRMGLENATYLLDQIFKTTDAAKEYRKNIESFLVRTCMVKDYKNRIISILPEELVGKWDSLKSTNKNAEGENIMLGEIQIKDITRLNIAPYYSYFDRVNGPKLNELDHSNLDNFEHKIFGPVMHVSRKSIRNMCYEMHGDLGESPVDPFTAEREIALNEKMANEAEITKNDANKVKAETNLLKKKAELMDTFTKALKNYKGDKALLAAAVILGEIVDKAALGTVLGLDIGKTLGDKK